jgi:hypothetical protein
MKLSIRSPRHYDEIEITHIKGRFVGSEPMHHDGYVASWGWHGERKLKPLSRIMPESEFHIESNLYVPQKPKINLTFKDRMELL